MALTKAQLRMVQRRRTSDLDRLSQQYKKNVQNLTGDFEKSFSQFQKQRAETMAPYEAELEKYKTQIYPDYEKQVEGYRQRLDAYNAALEDVQANPVQLVGRTIGGGKRGFMYEIDGQRYSERAGLPEGYSVDENQNLYKSRPIPQFNERAPVAPAAPQAPQVAAFDTEAFEQRKAGLETEFKREVGERKAGRMAAVSRRTARPMLQGS